MKNVLYAILTISILIAWMATPTNAQTTKRITITKEIQQEDGTIVREIIIKEGDAAEDFDLDDYLEDNGEEVVNLNIEMDEDRDMVIERFPNTKPCKPKSCKPSTCQSKRGFLGVSPMSRINGQEGARVSIVDNSAAERAGLQRGDVITQLDDQPIRSWDDISGFMRGTERGQEIDLTYVRDGQASTVSLELGSRNEGADNRSWVAEEWQERFGQNFDMDFDFDNAFEFEVDEKTKEACLGVYSHRSSQMDGSRISSFTDNSAAEEAGMQEGDIVRAVNGIEVEDHDQLWDEIAKYKADETVTVRYNRNGLENTISVQLNPCNGKTESNPFVNTAPRTKKVIREVIVIRKMEEVAEVPTEEAAPLPISTSRNLNLNAYRAFPNPTDGIVNIEFEAPAAPTTVSLYDLSGRQLFSEEMNSFDGSYARQFDLSAYMTSAVVLAVQQGEEVFTERILVRRN